MRDKTKKLPAAVQYSPVLCGAVQWKKSEKPHGVGVEDGGRDFLTTRIAYRSNLPVHTSRQHHKRYPQSSFSPYVSVMHSLERQHFKIWP